MFVSEIPYERILFAYYTHSVGYVIRCQVCIDIYTYICTHIYIYISQIASASLFSKDVIASAL